MIEGSIRYHLEREILFTNDASLDVKLGFQSLVPSLCVYITMQLSVLDADDERCVYGVHTRGACKSLHMILL